MLILWALALLVSANGTALAQTGNLPPPPSEDTPSIPMVIEGPAPEPAAEQAAPPAESPSAQLAEPRLETLTGVPQVIDGRTLRLNGIQVVLFGIDVPAPQDALGAEAAGFLSDIVDGSQVLCYILARRENGGVLSLCGSSAAADLSEAMIRAGYARVQAIAANDPGIGPFYTAAEAEARSKGLGVWSPSMASPAEAMDVVNQLMANIDSPRPRAAGDAPVPPPSPKFVDTSSLSVPVAASEIALPDGATARPAGAPVPQGQPVASAPAPVPDPAAAQAAAPSSPPLPVADTPAKMALSPPVDGMAQAAQRLAQRDGLAAPAESPSYLEAAIADRLAKPAEDEALPLPVAEEVPVQAEAPRRGFFGSIFHGIYASIAWVFHTIERFQVLLVGFLILALVRALFAEALDAYESQGHIAIDRASDDRHRIAERQARLDRAERLFDFATMLQAETSGLQHDLAARADVARIAADQEAEDIRRTLPSLKFSVPAIFADYADIGALGYKTAYAVRSLSNRLHDLAQRLDGIDALVPGGIDLLSAELTQAAGGFDEAAQEARMLYEALHDQLGKRLQQQQQQQRRAA
jgi:endonuclease YncB( thermonuclease family)